MRSVAFRESCVAVACAALLWFVGSEPSWAQAKDEHLFVSGTDLKTVLFGSLDAGRSSFITLGAKQTLSGPLDRSGFVSLAAVGYGGTPARADFETNSNVVVRPTVQASAMIGYQWTLDRVFVAGFIGPEVDAQQPVTIGEIPRLSHPRLGLRIQGELWANPTENTLLTATVVGGTARGHLWGRTAFGCQIWNDVFIGPEASLSMAETYREWRVGAHVTGLQLGRFTFGLSGGWRGEDDSPHHGAYVNILGYVRM